MIDPITLLALNVFSNKGVYAVMLGSGISRAADIPTGWGITLDLIRRIADTQREDCGREPDAWYELRYGKKPDYSSLLEQLGKTPTERNQILRGYFEPTPEERADGKKLPTQAHEAIARLVADGYVRVIITTNFDRLMEQALVATGVTPTVISTTDAIEGASPLAHSPCTLIKVHGDYLDTRIKNTPDELDHYDKPMNRLLDRVFDEYGLIVCGWSADYDTALRRAIRRCPNRRFSTFWAKFGDLGAAAQGLVNRREATVMDITGYRNGADTFFDNLAEKIKSLEEGNRQHPISKQVAVASLKRYLTDNQPIRLHDLVTEEVERVRTILRDPEQFSTHEMPLDANTVAQRLKRYKETMDTLLALVATGCFWAEPEHYRLWLDGFERLLNSVESHDSVGWVKLQRYPAMLYLYAAGIAAIAAERYGMFATLLTQSKQIEYGRAEAMAIADFGPVLVLDGMLKPRPVRRRLFTPGSDHLHTALRELLRPLVPDDAKYTALFDRFEYLFALVSGDLRQKAGEGIEEMLDSYIWRDRHSNVSTPQIIAREVAEYGGEWPPLKAGLFGGSTERFNQIKAAIDELHGRASMY